MQTIYIDVKDQYVSNILTMLKGVKDVMIDKIRIDTPNSPEASATSEELMELQSSSMQKTWDNADDKAWDEL